MDNAHYKFIIVMMMMMMMMMMTCLCASLETQGQMVGRGKVGTGEQKVGEEKSRALYLCP